VSRPLWFRPDYAGWDPHLYEAFFRIPLCGALRAREESTIYDFLGNVLERGHCVLEVGCGTGNYTVPVARRCARTVAVDASPKMLRYARDSGRVSMELSPSAS
jgi:ubiquinone/menaquinone biosynthesis C-methylase UbiE